MGRTGYRLNFPGSRLGRECGKQEPRGPWGQRVSFRASFSSLTLPLAGPSQALVVCPLRAGLRSPRVTPTRYSTALALGHLLTALITLGPGPGSSATTADGILGHSSSLCPASKPLAT